MTDYVVAWVIIGAVAWSQGLRFLAWHQGRREQRRAEHAAWRRHQGLVRRPSRPRLHAKPSPVAIRLDMWNLAANDLLAADLLIERINQGSKTS